MNVIGDIKVQKVKIHSSYANDHKSFPDTGTNKCGRILNVNWINTSICQLWLGKFYKFIFLNLHPVILIPNNSIYILMTIDLLQHYRTPLPQFVCDLVLCWHCLYSPYFVWDLFLVLFCSMDLLYQNLGRRVVVSFLILIDELWQH